MRTLNLALVLGLAVTASPAKAVDLHWSNGDTNLNFASATRCTLIVQADSGCSLPPQWDLVYRGPIDAVTALWLPTGAACADSVAQAWSIELPRTAADSSFNFCRASFCASTANAARRALYVFDVVGGATAKFKVVAPDPADTSQLVVSNEATLNYGSDTPYPTDIVRAFYAHDTTALTVTVQGSDLASASDMMLVGPEHCWDFPLTIDSATDTQVQGSGSSIAAVPACNVDLTLAVGTSSAPLPQEPLNLPPVSLSGPQDMFDPDDHYFCRDFAMIATPGKIHMFYIRHALNGVRTNPNSLPIQDNNHVEINFGHQWTSDWSTWRGSGPPPTYAIAYADTTVLAVGGSTDPVSHVVYASPGSYWDNTQVYAPTIVQDGMTFYMFYTGVKDSTIGANHKYYQRIGYATSTDLKIWSRQSHPSIVNGDFSWMDATSVNLRDPFVMSDPTFPNHWLLYYVGPVSSTGHLSVAVAASKDTVLGSGWIDKPLLTNADWAHTFAENGNREPESPHVFKHRDQWWLLHSPFNAPNGYHVLLQYRGDRPFNNSDANDASNWHSPSSELYTYLSNDSRVQYWYASEYLAVLDPTHGGQEILGAVNALSNGLSFGRMLWTAGMSGSTDSFILSDPLTAVEAPGPVVLDGAGLSWKWKAGGVEFSIRTPNAENCAIEIFDVGGRLLRRIHPNPVAGLQHVRWNGGTEWGGKVGSGVYFARLSTGKHEAVAKFPYLR